MRMMQMIICRARRRKGEARVNEQAYEEVEDV